LFTGDAVINRFFPIFPDADASGKNWLSILDKLDALHPRIVVPGHGGAGEASLIATEREYLQAVKQRVAALKSQGKSAEETAKLLTVEFRTKYPNWENPGWIADAVERFYAEGD
jgi:glyoxylase-like metal-dependent hydrolase (beta-lactamase superfamily II)